MLLPTELPELLDIGAVSSVYRQVDFKHVHVHKGITEFTVHVQ